MRLFKKYAGRNYINVFFFFFQCFSTPAYDYAPNPDKQWILQVVDRMEPIQKKFTDTLMTKRLQTLQSIDEGIERVSFETSMNLGAIFRLLSFTLCSKYKTNLTYFSYTMSLSSLENWKIRIFSTHPIMDII